MSTSNHRTGTDIAIDLILKIVPDLIGEAATAINRGMGEADATAQALERVRSRVVAAPVSDEIRGKWDESETRLADPTADAADTQPGKRSVKRGPHRR